MGQYTVAEYLHRSDASTSSEIARKTKDSSSSVSQSLTILKRKEIVKLNGNKWEFHPDATEQDLEAIKPTSLSKELDDDNS